MGLLNIFNRRGRVEGEERTTPGATAEAHPYQINEFFVFRGVLFGRGIVEHSKGDTPRLSVKFKNGVSVRFTYSVDPTFSSTETRTAFEFHVDVPVGADVQDLASAMLLIHFANEHLEIANPTWERQRSDKFLESEAVFWTFVNSLPQGRVLEIGSRARSDITRKQLFPSHLEYVGLDIVAGPNVDFVGDAHDLSHLFPADHFDAVFSVSVWEHLAMPWKVSLELNKVMKLGGIAMINTHQSWPAHEEPWDYFRFSEHSWASLFNRETGFEIVAKGMGLPCVMTSVLAAPPIGDATMQWNCGYLASRCVVKKCATTKLTWPVETSVVSDTTYGF